MTTYRSATILLALTLACAGPSFLGGCREKGPAEKAGEKLDDAKEKVEDAVDPKGPAEKAGRKLDKAVGN